MNVGQKKDFQPSEVKEKGKFTEMRDRCLPDDEGDRRGVSVCIAQGARRGFAAIHLLTC